MTAPAGDALSHDYFKEPSGQGSEIFSDPILRSLLEAPALNESAATARRLRTSRRCASHQTTLVPPAFAWSPWGTGI